MLLIDVAVPAAGQRYDFEVVDNISVEVVIHEMLEIVCQKERRVFGGDASTVCLYSREKEKQLPADMTLRQCGIRSGETLILL